MMNPIGSLWRWFNRPAVWAGQGFLLAIGVFGGIIFWGGFNTALEATNNLEFCISCHEMRDTVYQEYTQSIHYRNASGVRAECPDCHVPHAFVPKMIRKIEASGEVWSSLMGTIDTPEKFEAHRLEMATHVWSVMKSTDSRECRNCHSWEAMDFEHQRQRSRETMQPVADGTNLTQGSTCIDCHKGIAHKLPKVPHDD